MCRYYTFMDIPTAEHVQHQISALMEQLSDPAVQRDVAKMKALSREHTEQEQLLALIHDFARTTADLIEAQELFDGDDEEIRALAADDIERLTKTKEHLEGKITELLIPKDPLDSRNVILEIRAGAGGDEAGLFAAELLRAYTRYAEEAGWHVHIVSSSQNEQGGYKEVIAEVAGDNVFGVLKFERGVHRVQRVPETEKQGRIHTSTVTVAVMPEVEEVDIEIRPEDLRIDTYRASGAGGQHVNKTDSAIRITHLPTNTVVAVQDERSQHKNKAKAMSLLRARIYDAQEQARRKKEAQIRKLQVGTGDRSEKIRTYNFPQDRITDHRIKESWGNIEGIMAGQLGDIFATLRKADQTLRSIQ